MFSKPEFKELLGAYNLVQLYTDQVPNEFYAPPVRDRFGNDLVRQKEDALTNQWFQLTAFSNEQLPLYVILEPLADGKVEVVGIYDEAKINNERGFAEFLRKPLSEGGVKTAQVAAR